MSEFEKQVGAATDVYFKNTARIVETHGDQTATYAVFIRRPVISAPKLALDFLHQAEQARGFRAGIDLRYPEGKRVGAGDPILYITGPMAKLADLETGFLQRLGPACVAAYNACTMCSDLPGVAFIDMGARHCAGAEMADMMAYGAAVGSARAKRKAGAKGFIASSTDRTAHFFGQAKGAGTMPHALIGYAGSTLKAARMFRETLPDMPLTVLVDYFGREVTDSLEVAKAFPDLAEAGQLSLRLDTPGSRYLEGLDPTQSYAVLERHVPQVIRGYLTADEQRHLIGTGVSAAAIWHIREQLDEAGFDKVKIVASSGFSPAKCRLMATAQAPIDVIGTGSFLPENWPETYATADIIEYDGVPRVKASREYLLRK
jgi:nicotinate phosphoribosyltransferase